MKWLVCYDIADDGRRSRLVNTLLDYGQRVQESVFWVDVDEELAGRMKARVNRIVAADQDSVWLVAICDACARKVEAIGVGRVPEIPDFYVV